MRKQVSILITVILAFTILLPVSGISDTEAYKYNLRDSSFWGGRSFDKHYSALSDDVKANEEFFLLITGGWEKYDIIPYIENNPDIYDMGEAIYACAYHIPNPSTSYESMLINPTRGEAFDLIAFTDKDGYIISLEYVVFQNIINDNSSETYLLEYPIKILSAVTGCEIDHIVEMLKKALASPGDVFSDDTVEYSISERNNTFVYRIRLIPKNNTVKGALPTATPSPTPTPVPTEVPVFAPEDETIYKAAHQELGSATIYVDDIAARDNNNRYIVTINKGFKALQYAMLIEFDYSGQYYNIYAVDRDPTGYSLTDKGYGILSIAQYENLFQTNPNFHWGEPAWVYDGDQSRAYGQEACSIQRTSDIDAQLDYGDLYGLEPFTDVNDTSSDTVIISEDALQRRDAANTTSSPPEYNPSDTLVISAAKLAWGPYANYEKIQILDKDAFNHFIVRIYTAEPNSEDVIAYVVFNSSTDRFVMITEGQLGFFKASVGKTSDMSNDDLIEMYKNASVFHWNKSTDEIPDNEYYYLDNGRGSDYFYINHTSELEPDIGSVQNASAHLESAKAQTPEPDVYSGNESGSALAQTPEITAIPEPTPTPKPTVTPQNDHVYLTSAKTAKASVNLRKEPDKNSKLLIKIKKKGTALVVLGDCTGADGELWYKVRYKEKTGFIRNDLINLDKLSDSDKAEDPNDTEISNEMEISETSDNWSTDVNTEIYGIAIKKLATRSGPSPYAEDTGTYFVKGKRIRIYTRAYDPVEDAWWVKCDIPYHGKIRTLWAWYTRFDSKTLPLDSIPIDEEYQ